MNMSEYNITVHGVPLSYYGGRPEPEPEQTDDEWCADMGITPPPDTDNQFPETQESETPTMSTAFTLVVMTNDKGEAACDLFEPEPSSVVLTEGEFGTAWQRHFNDGRWYRLGSSKSLTWAELLETKRNIRLAYDAPVRTNQSSQRGRSS